MLNHKEYLLSFLILNSFRDQQYLPGKYEPSVQRTMIFNRQYHCIRRCCKSTAVDSFSHGSKWNLVGEGVAMIGQEVTHHPIPTVQLYTATASKMYLMTNIICHHLPYSCNHNNCSLPDHYVLNITNYY
jgi:hypothetical protein